MSHLTLLENNNRARVSHVPQITQSREEESESSTLASHQGSNSQEGEGELESGASNLEGTQFSFLSESGLDVENGSGGPDELSRSLFAKGKAPYLS
jgi:hypothetical protein